MSLKESLQYCAASELKIEFRHGPTPDKLLLLAHTPGDHHAMREFPLDTFLEKPEEILRFFLLWARDELDKLSEESSG